MRSLGVKEMLDFLISCFNVLHVVLFLYLLPEGLAHAVFPLIPPVTSQGGQVGRLLTH